MGKWGEHCEWGNGEGVVKGRMGTEVGRDEWGGRWEGTNGEGGGKGIGSEL